MTVVARVSREVEAWSWCSYPSHSHIFHGS